MPTNVQRFENGVKVRPLTGTGAAASAGALLVEGTDGVMVPYALGGGLTVDHAARTITASGGAVTSVFTRTGAVVAVMGDYAVAQITGAAPLASPTLTGTPTAPTAAPGTATTQLATTAFVGAAVTAGGATPVATTTVTGTVKLAAASADPVVPLTTDPRLSDARTPLAHDLVTAHTATGLTAGHVLRATGATGFAFGALLAGDLPTVPTTKGGTGLTALGLAGQVLTVNAGATALEYATPASGGSGIPATLVDAKGDLIAASANDVVARLAVGADGQVLTADAASTLGLKWATPASGGGSAAGSFSPDAAPTTPSALDDEFTGGPGLAAKWTTVNAATPAAITVNTTLPKGLHVSYAAAAAAQTLTALLQTLPAGDFTVVLSYALGSSDGGAVGLVLATGTTAGAGTQHAVIAYGAGTSGYRQAAFSYTTFNAFSATLAADLPGGARGYLRLRRSGAAYSIAWSADGGTWHVRPITPGGTITHVGIVTQRNTATAMEAGADWFRYAASATATFGA